MTVNITDFNLLKIQKTLQTLSVLYLLQTQGRQVKGKNHWKSVFLQFEDLFMSGKHLRKNLISSD